MNKETFALAVQCLPPCEIFAIELEINQIRFFVNQGPNKGKFVWIFILDEQGKIVRNYSPSLDYYLNDKEFIQKL